MVNLTFANLFKLTTMGTPNMKQLPSSITMTKSYFEYSTIIQAIFLLFLMFQFALSIFRVVKKIKNNKFRDVPDPQQLEKKKRKAKKKCEEKAENKKQDDLIYEFDEDEAEGSVEERDNKVMDINGQSRSKQDDFDKYHDENEKQFIKMDKQLLLLQPFLISFIICNNLFASDLITIGLIVLTITSFFIFNIKSKLNHIKALQFLFIIFSLLAYFSFFYNDHDITT